jgi:hypothetical protein
MTEGILRGWPTFHRDGTVSIPGETLGRWYKVRGMFSGTVVSVSFECRCGANIVQWRTHSLRTAISDHAGSDDHADRLRGKEQQ